MRPPAVALTLLSVFFRLDRLSGTRSKSTKNQNQPHIIFILIDDQGFNDIGYHNPNILSPTLDKLASEGVKLENYYVQPICTPSRSQLITGRYQIHTGLQHSIIRPSQPSCLPSHLDTLPQRLQQLGYRTHLVGKWHLGFYRKACLPTRKGFDTFFGSLTGSVDYYSYGSCDGPGVCGYDLHDDEGVAWGQEGKYSTTLFTQRARKVLEGHDPTERPLFLLLSLQAVHTPLQPPKSYIYPYRDMANVARRKFAAMVSTVDEAVRNVTYALRKFGFYKNSVIIYSTDNGAQPFTGGSNWPLRGRKGTYWEGGVRGVAFVHSPLLKRRKRVCKELMHITDWFPTLVALGGGNTSQSQGLDGFDVWPTISEGKPSPRTEILHNIDPLHKPPTPSSTWTMRTDGDSVIKPKGPVFKKTLKTKKKKILHLKPKQKSAFRLKTTKKPAAFLHQPSKSQSKLKVKGQPKPNLKIKGQPKPKLKSKTEPKPKLKLKVQTKAQQKTSTNHRPRTKHNTHEDHNLWVSGTSGSEAPPVNRQDLKLQRTLAQNNDQNQSGSTQPKSRTHKVQLTFKSKSRRTITQYQNLTGPRTTHLPGPWATAPLPEPGATHPQSLWDTSIQAAIRVGDWKLLTGDPGHGDWVPPQVLTSLPGRWWNLERTSKPKTLWLFNISSDPYERQDLSDQRPDVVRLLLDRLVYYNRTAVPVYFPPDDPRANPDHHRGAWVPWVDLDQDQNLDQDPQDKYQGVYKNRKSNRKKKKGKGRLCQLQTFFLKLNTRMMSNRI